MLQILDEKVLKTDDEIERLYRNCKYLCIIDSYDKLADNNRGAIGVQYELLCQHIGGIAHAAA